ncbi:MAG TPA: type II toxin-antitoxin system death-on-curing family toxin [Stellaceae bacterium]|jgi:death-on-curing protein|nr:type II toxin-antitoxin system death-on-curing family toxin [Stellaceae bacterium]
MDYRWVGLRAALAIHDLQIAEHGGPDGLRDMALLESALARPHQLLAYGTPDIATLAACYAGGISRNHPCVDGNKRAAWLLATTFLDLNGYDVEADMADALQAMLSLAAGTLAEEDFAAWLRERLLEIGNASD